MKTSSQLPWPLGPTMAILLDLLIDRETLLSMVVLSLSLQDIEQRSKESTTAELDRPIPNGDGNLK